MIRNPLSTQQKQQLLQTQTALSTLEQLLFFKDNWAETYNIPDSPTLDLDKVEGLADYLSQAELQTISQQQVQQSVEQNVQQAIRSTQERVSPSTPSLLRSMASTERRGAERRADRGEPARRGDQKNPDSAKNRNRADQKCRETQAERLTKFTR